MADSPSQLRCRTTYVTYGMGDVGISPRWKIHRCPMPLLSRVCPARVGESTPSRGASRPARSLPSDRGREIASRPGGLYDRGFEAPRLGSPQLLRSCIQPL